MLPRGSIRKTRPGGRSTSCNAINYGNQQGDYAGVASYGGVAHPIWVDSRANQDPAPGCSRGIKMEEVFTAAVK